MHHLLDLSQIELFSILDFLGILDLYRFSVSSKYSSKFAFKDLLWEKFCGFETSRNSSLYFDCKQWDCKKTLKSWVCDELWSWEDGWQFQNEEIPNPRYLHRMVTCPIDQHSIYCFGGADSEDSFNDTWCFKIEGRQVDTSQVSCQNNGPLRRFAVSLTACADFIFMFGGGSHSFGQFYNDLWCYHIASQKWLICHTTGVEPNENAANEPSPRWAHTMISHKNQKMILFGGSSPGMLYNDLWILQPKVDFNHCDISLEEGAELFKTMIWERVSIEGSIPSKRCGHAAAVYDNFMYIHGGNNTHQTFDDMYRINLDNMGAWEPLNVSESGPGPRIGHSMIALHDKLVVYGGRDRYNSVYETGLVIYDLRTFEWERKTLGNEPQPRTGHSSVLFPDGIFVFGGLVEGQNDSAEFCNELHFLSFSDTRHSNFG